MSEPLRFAFGKNWQAFLETFSEERFDNARRNLLRSLRLEHLEGLRFLDIGSGSGLHSLAAWRSGAAQVVSFDYDPDSVQATRSLWRLAGEPANWTVLQGSVLDEAFVRSLGGFDIVYSWGVLHHTGDMWRAIRNACLGLDGQGVFFIALYSHTSYRDGALSGQPEPEEWLAIKQRYNAASPARKRRMEYGFLWRSYFRHAFPHPVGMLRSAHGLWRTMREYKQSRGMEFSTDIRDWLGGWPMEFIREEECVEFCGKELGLEILELNTGEGNTEFLFRPAGSSNYWDALLAQRHVLPLPRPYLHVRGQMWQAFLSQPPGPGQRLTLLEDGAPLIYRNAQESGISAYGEGRYRLQENTVLFSTSSRDNPNENGRNYAYFCESRT